MEVQNLSYGHYHNDEPEDQPAAEVRFMPCSRETVKWRQGGDGISKAGFNHIPWVLLALNTRVFGLVPAVQIQTAPLGRLGI